MWFFISGCVLLKVNDDDKQKCACTTIDHNWRSRRNILVAEDANGTELFFCRQCRDEGDFLCFFTEEIERKKSYGRTLM